MSTNFISAELFNVMPVPVKETDSFKIQIKSDYDNGRSTKWMNITPEQFMAIEQILHGVNPFIDIPHK